MQIYSKKIEGRAFLILGEEVVIPIDRIKTVELDAGNRDCMNRVRIHTDDPEDELYFNYSDADSVRDFFKE